MALQGKLWGMTMDARQPYLDALGLTLWQRRVVAGALPAVAETVPVFDLHPEAAPPASEPAPTAAVPAAARTREPGPEPAPLPEPTLGELDWDALAAHLATQDTRGAARAVFGVGARDADLLVIGEAPGAEEDRRGEPFVGRAGQLLDRMLFAIGRARTRDVYIANICKFRPPNNRDPHSDEVAADRPYLERQIELLAPRLILALGRTAAQTLLQTTTALGRLRGQVHRYPGRDIPVLVTYHPAYLLRSPHHKARAWADLRQALQLLAASK